MGLPHTYLFRYLIESLILRRILAYVASSPPVGSVTHYDTDRRVSHGISCITCLVKQHLKQGAIDYFHVCKYERKLSVCQERHSQPLRFLSKLSKPPRNYNQFVFKTGLAGNTNCVVSVVYVLKYEKILHQAKRYSGKF